VHAVRHVVGRERALDLADDLLVRRDALECEREGGRAQAGEMLFEREDATVVEAKSFPNRVAALDRAVERRDAASSR
jgi:hypothetical protein